MKSRIFAAPKKEMRMKTEMDPAKTSRGAAFALWMKSPMPMVTLTKTMDVSRLVRFAKRHNYPFNMLLCWCIGRAASRIEEFYLLPEGGKLMRYDRLAINVIVPNRQGGINSCDILFNEDLRQFNADYARLTARWQRTVRVRSGRRQWW